MQQPWLAMPRPLISTLDIPIPGKSSKTPYPSLPSGSISSKCSQELSHCSRLESGQAMILCTAPRIQRRGQGNRCICKTLNTCAYLLAAYTTFDGRKSPDGRVWQTSPARYQASIVAAQISDEKNEDYADVEVPLRCHHGLQRTLSR